MVEDDVLRGVRDAREAFARTHGFDPHAMVAALRALDAADDWPVVRAGPYDPSAVGVVVTPDPSPHPAGEFGR